MFKRPRLSPTSLLVNAGLATSLIFLAACGGEKAQSGVNIEEDTAPAPAATSPVAAKKSYDLQAVWASQPLSAPITDLAFTGGPEPILAAVYETGDLQLFNLLGDRMTEAADLNIKALATGQAVVLNDVALTLFPGIGATGDINFYAYASALGDPVQLDFLPGLGASGLCAGTPIDQTAVMQLAYWSEDTPEDIVHGHVRQDSQGELSWDIIETLVSPGGPISACLAEAKLEITAPQRAQKLASLNKFGLRYTLAQTGQGTLSIIGKTGVPAPANIIDGITVRAPKEIKAMAALSDVFYGNYPNGLVVVGGEVNGKSKIVFIEPNGLF